MNEGARPEMESDLLDFSADDEDSWLQQNLHSDGASALSDNCTGSRNAYFSCSPLQIPRSNHLFPACPPLSPIGEVMGNRNAELPSPSIVTDSFDKENISGNKVELSKLSGKPQQMKRKKKTAGFNLRKSLAWDRAFFTEEGVLDSVELSIITGNDCQTGGETLPSIQEERRESILASNCSSYSPGLRAIEEKLFKELPVNSKNKEKKVMGGILPNNASPSKAPSSSRRLLSVQDAKSSSKSSGCPRPHAPLSLKRPANAHMAKAQNKELRVSKVSATRSESLKVANAVKKSTPAPSKVKQIQSAQSNGNSQKSLGPTSSSKKTSSAQSRTKSSLASKLSIPKPSVNQARTNVISTASKTTSASNLQHSVAVNSDKSLMTKSDLAPPLLGHGSNFQDSGSSNVAVSVPQGSCSSIENVQSAMPRVPRSSGLRMPSPSIGFFSQSQYTSHGSLENSSQALLRRDSATNYSLIPTFKKSQVTGKVPRVNTKTASGNIGGLGSTTVSSAPRGPLQPSKGRMKTELKSNLEKELKLPCNRIRSQTINSLQHPSVFPDDAEKVPLDNTVLCKYEKISSEKVEELQSNSKMLPLSSKSNEQENQISDGKGEVIRKTCTTEAYSALLPKCDLTFEDSVDSLGQRSSDDELKLDNQRGVTTCKSNDLNGDLDGLGSHGQPLNAYMPPGNEDEVGIFLSKENYMPVVDHSTKSITKQLEISDSCTVHPAVCEAFALSESNTDYLSSSGNQSGDTVSVLISSEHVEARDIIKSPYNHHKENRVLVSIQCGDDLVRDGLAVTQQERTDKVMDITEEKYEADLVVTFPDYIEPFRESKDLHFSGKVAPEVKEGDHEIDVLTRNETADEDDGPEMLVECPTGSVVAEQDMEQVNSPKSFRDYDDQSFLRQLVVSEVKERDQELDVMTRNETTDVGGPEMNIDCLTGFPVAEKNMEQVNLSMLCRDSEDHHFSRQPACEVQERDHKIDAMTRNKTACEDIGPETHIECLAGFLAEQNMEQVNIPTPFSPEVRLEDQTQKPFHEPFPVRLTSGECKQSHCSKIANRKQTDWLGLSDSCSFANEVADTVASFSTKQPEINSVQKGIDLVVETELISDHSALNDAIGTELKSSATSSSGDPYPSNAQGTEFNSSATSISGDPEPLSNCTDLSRSAKCIPKKQSVSGSAELSKCVRKAESRTEMMIRTDSESGAQVTDPDLGSHEEEEVPAVRNYPDPEAYLTREEELGPPMSTDKAGPVGAVVQPNEFIIVNADTSISENTGADASGNSCSPETEIVKEPKTYSTEDMDKMSVRDAKLEKRPDPLVVKPPPNALPFSDEWLAAIEAAGEEILTMKTGPVQHSPPEKPAYEPGPWSPVKRKKNQGVGPFDCTKFTNNGIPPSFD